MGISEIKKKIVLENYFKSECDVDTSIKEAFIKGFELGLKKAPKQLPKTDLDEIRTKIEGMTPTYHNLDWSITDLVPISEVIKLIDKYRQEN